jgi:hypothetical protein
VVTGSIPGLSTSKKRFSSRAYERTCGMVRGKTRGTHSISNLLFSLFKIGHLPATQNSGGCGGDMGGAPQQGWEGGSMERRGLKSKRKKNLFFCYLQGKLDFLLPQLATFHILSRQTSLNSSEHTSQLIWTHFSSHLNTFLISSEHTSQLIWTHFSTRLNILLISSEHNSQFI